MIRPLPVCPPPYQDEAVDPWIERIAREYHLSRPRFLCAAGVRERLSGRTCSRDPVRLRELPALASLTRTALADLRRRAGVLPPGWAVRAPRDFIVCLYCIGTDLAERRVPYQRAVWHSAAHVACTADRHWLWSARARFGGRRIDQLFRLHEPLPLTTWIEHLQRARESLDRLDEQHPDVPDTVREIQSAVEGALRGADPPEDLWGPIEAPEFLHVVRDVTSWAITNFESFRAHPPAHVVPPCLYLGAFEPFRWPDRRLASWDARIGANRLDRVFDPSMRRAALWTAHSLLANRHPRRSHERRALSLNERRQRAFRYQSAEGLAWLVARARHWPRRYVRDQWSNFALVRKLLR